MVLRGRQCCASVVAKAHLVGGGVRARVFRRDLREYPGAHYEMCARPRSGAIFGHIHACDIRCLRSAVLQPPGRTPAVVARGTRAFCLVRAMPFAPWLVLRVAARRRSLSYALSRGAGFCLTRRCPVAEMDCARGGPRGFAKAHLVGGDVRARVFRRDLREHPGAHHEICFSNSRAATSAVGGGRPDLIILSCNVVPFHHKSQVINENKRK